MKHSFKLLVVAAVAGTTLLTACDTDDSDCDSSTVLIYSTYDHHYHYGSPKGKLVPAAKVPSSARKVPGYKPYTPPKPKVDMNKPKPAPKAPAPRPAAPRPGRR